MTDPRAIADRVEIEALRGEFTGAVMMGDRARLASPFTPDGVLRTPNVPVELAGREEIRAGAVTSRMIVHRRRSRLPQQCRSGAAARKPSPASRSA